MTGTSNTPACFAFPDLAPPPPPTEEQMEPSRGLPLRTLLTATRQSLGVQQQSGLEPQPAPKTPGYPISPV